MNLQNELINVTNWIRDYFAIANINGETKAVIGLSGGIDSAVVASLAARALGTDAILGLILPCESNPQDEEDAKKIAESIGIRTKKIDLNSICTEAIVSIAPCLEKAPKNMDLFVGNLKARLRMITLYMAASSANALVLGTTNKTEALLGYCTKYGDNAVDVEPIADFYKTEVFELAVLLSNIPYSIITKAPSAGLWKGQTDEEEIGLSYSRIDKLLQTNLLAASPKELELLKPLLKSGVHKNLSIPMYRRQIDEA